MSATEPDVSHRPLSVPAPLVRRASPADHAVVGEITVAAYAPFTTGPDDFYIARLRDAARRDREAELWVAELDGAVVGSVTLAPAGSPWREIARDGEGEFRMLSVAPVAQGHGVGRALIRLADERFADLGCAAVVLSSLAEMAPAHRLYARAGYVRTPERDWAPTPEVHLVAFRKEL